MAKRWRLVVWLVAVLAVTSCGYGRLGTPVSVPREKTVTLAWGDLKIRNCYYVREYLVRDDEKKNAPEEWYNHLSITVNGKEMEIEKPVGMGVITVDGYEITILEMEPEREIKCTVIVERIK